MHNDVHVTELSSREEDMLSEKKKNTDATADLKNFFKAAPPVAGSNKARSQCMLWVWVIYYIVIVLITDLCKEMELDVENKMQFL